MAHVFFVRLLEVGNFLSFYCCNICLFLITTSFAKSNFVYNFYFSPIEVVLTYCIRGLVLQCLISLKLIWQKLHCLFLQPRDLNLAVDLQVKGANIIAKFQLPTLYEARFLLNFKSIITRT